MAKMKATEAAVRVLEAEGVTTAFGVPGAAINPFYAAMREHGRIRHILARHVEGASHMADGYTRAVAGNIGVCIGTSGPAGTDMITGLYAAAADSLPILCITGQAPRAKLYKEDFQAVDIESIAKPVAKWAVTVREPGLVPRVFQQAFHVMRSGRPGPVLIDLPIDVQMARDRVRPRHLRAAAGLQAGRERRQIEKALDMLAEAEQPLIVAGGGVINADASDLLVEFAELTGVPVVPTLMGWGAFRTTIRSWPAWSACRRATATATRPARRPTSCSASAIAGRTGTRARSRATRRAGSSSTSTSSRPRSVASSIPTTASSRTRRRRSSCSSTSRKEWKAAGRLPDSRPGRGECEQRKKNDAAQDPLRQGADQAAARLSGDEQGVRPRHLLRDAPSACRRSPARSSCTSTSRATGSTAARPVRSAGPCRPRSACAPPIRTGEIVALSGDYDFQFMIEELAVGAQHKLPYLHVVVNNSYLGLIRQSQRGFEMDYERQLAFENINAAAMTWPATASTTSRSPRARLQGDARQEPERDRRRRSQQARAVDGGAPACRSSRDHPGARHQHRDGHRDPQRHRVRGRWRAGPRGRADAPSRLRCWRPSAARGRDETACPSSAPTSPCSTTSTTSWIASRPPAPTASPASSSCSPTPFPKEQLADALAAERADPGPAQPARRELGGRRARHRLLARPHGRVPGRRRPRDRVRHGARLPAAELPLGPHAAGRRPRARAPDRRRERPFRGRRVCARPASGSWSSR